MSLTTDGGRPDSAMPFWIWAGDMSEPPPTFSAARLSRTVSRLSTPPPAHLIGRRRLLRAGPRHRLRVLRPRPLAIHVPRRRLSLRPCLRIDAGAARLLGEAGRHVPGDAPPRLRTSLSVTDPRASIGPYGRIVEAVAPKRKEETRRRRDLVAAENFRPRFTLEPSVHAGSARDDQGSTARPAPQTSNRTCLFAALLASGLRLISRAEAVREAGAKPAVVCAKIGNKRPRLAELFQRERRDSNPRPPA
jgi:hypothetical protein